MPRKENGGKGKKGGAGRRFLLWGAKRGARESARVYQRKAIIEWPERRESQKAQKKPVLIPFLGQERGQHGL